MRLRYLSPLLALALVACSGSGAPGGSENASPTGVSATAEWDAAADAAATAVKEIYDDYLRGDYAAYVAHMQSLDDKSDDYKRQMALLYKQHAVDQKTDDGDVVSVEVRRVLPCGEVNKSGSEKQAVAYLLVTYTSGRSEEIYLQLVKTDGEWRLR